jgi:phage nucleotide-binding protein
MTQTLEEKLATAETTVATADIQVTSQDIFEKIGASSPEETAKWLNSLIYGEPGSGKTYLSGTADDSLETSPLLVIDIDGGLMTIRKRRNVKVVTIRAYDDLVRLYGILHSAIDTTTDTLPFKTLSIDNLTELQKLDMKDIMAITPAVLEGRQDPSVPSMREWGISQDHIRKVVRAFRDLPCHTIFTCHVDIKPDNQNRNIYGPDLPGKLRNQITGFVDVVGYLYATEHEGEIVRKLQTAKTDTVIAKDRLNSIGDVVINPTIPMMVSKIGEKVV